MKAWKAVNEAGNTTAGKLLKGTSVVVGYGGEMSGTKTGEDIELASGVLGLASGASELAEGLVANGGRIGGSLGETSLGQMGKSAMSYAKGRVGGAGAAVSEGADGAGSDGAAGNGAAAADNAGCTLPDEESLEGIGGSEGQDWLEGTLPADGVSAAEQSGNMGQDVAGGTRTSLGIGSVIRAGTDVAADGTSTGKGGYAKTHPEEEGGDAGAEVLAAADANAGASDKPADTASA